MTSYCPRCTCPDCAAETARRQEDLAQRLAKREMQRAKQEARLDELARRRDLTFQQGCMIWLLVNTVRNSESAKSMITAVGEVLEIRDQMVAARRQIYCSELGRRVSDAEQGDEPHEQRLREARALGQSWLHPHTWIKIPGTRDNDLVPDTWPVTREHERGRR